VVRLYVKIKLWLLATSIRHSLFLHWFMDLPQLAWKGWGGFSAILGN